MSDSGPHLKHFVSAIFVVSCQQCSTVKRWQMAKALTRDSKDSANQILLTSEMARSHMTSLRSLIIILVPSLDYA